MAIYKVARVVLAMVFAVASASAATLNVGLPQQGHRFLTSPGGTVDVPLTYGVQNFDLGPNGKVCFSIFRVEGETEELFSPPSCLASVQQLTVTKMPAGTFRVLGSLTAANGVIVAHSPTRTFHVTTVFKPSYEWQTVTSVTEVQPGLEVQMAMDGSHNKFARIPPVWRVQMDLGPVAGLFRTDMARDTTVHQVKQAAAAHISNRYRVKGVEIPAGTCVALVKNGEKMPHTATVEQVDWFNDARGIYAGLQPCNSANPSAVTFDLNLLSRM